MLEIMRPYDRGYATFMLEIMQPYVIYLPR